MKTSFIGTMKPNCTGRAIGGGNGNVRSSRQALQIVAVKKGEKAPSFSLPNQDGRSVTVPARGKPTVLFFYPKDNTPGCTLEAKAFRDAYATLKSKGAQVVGVSSDSVESHKSFCNELELPYELLADTDGSIRKLYDVPSDIFGLLPGRQTFVISKDGTVAEVFNNQFSPEKHVEVALEALNNTSTKSGWSLPFGK